MEKRISFDQFQSVKRVAQACNPLMMKREAIKKKIEDLAVQYKDYDAQISALEAGIKQVIGFRVEQLVKKVMEPGVDANGQPKKTTKYLPTSIVTYDESKKQYVITLPDAEPANTEEESAPNDSTQLQSSATAETPEAETPTADNDPFADDDNIPSDAPIFE